MASAPASAWRCSVCFQKAGSCWSRNTAEAKRLALLWLKRCGQQTRLVPENTSTSSPGGVTDEGRGRAGEREVGAPGCWVSPVQVQRTKGHTKEMKFLHGHDLKSAMIS